MCICTLLRISMVHVITETVVQCSWFSQIFNHAINMATEQYSALYAWWEVDRQVQHISHSQSFISNAHSVLYITATEGLLTDLPFNCFKNNNNQQAHIFTTAYRDSDKVVWCIRIALFSLWMALSSWHPNSLNDISIKPVIEEQDKT